MSVLDLSGTNIAKIENSQEAMGFLLKKMESGWTSKCIPDL
jgi:hypothetical protein